MSCSMESTVREQNLTTDCGDPCSYKCCQVSPNLYKDLCLKFHDLYNKWRASQPKPRTRELAMPRRPRCKVRPAVHARPRRVQVQIIRDRPDLNTRAEQLAYTPVRRLIATRDAVRDYISPVVYERFNRYIHRGMQSMYARLSNALPPVIINPVKTWTLDDWEKYGESFKMLATPKKFFEPPEIVRESMPINKLLERLEVLAAPKSKPDKRPPRPLVNPAAMEYVATERVLSLAKPKVSKALPPRRQKTFRGKKFEVSERTKELAKHREKKAGGDETKENPYKVSPNAMKARPSSRVKTLAKPKEIPVPEAKDPYKISPAALKATPSKRIIDLAQPKKPAAKE